MKKLLFAMLMLASPVLADETVVSGPVGTFALQGDGQGEMYMVNTMSGHVWVVVTDPKTNRKVLVPCFVIFEKPTKN